MAPELISVGSSRIGTFLDESAELSRFRFSIEETLRSAPYTLSGDAEMVLAASLRPDVALATGSSLRVDDHALALVAKSTNRADRKLVYDAYWSGFTPLEGVLGETLNACKRMSSMRALAALRRRSMPHFLS